MRERIRRKLIMPDLVGLRERDAQIMLANAGFSPGTVRFVDAYENIGTVIQQKHNFFCTALGVSGALQKHS